MSSPIRCRGPWKIHKRTSEPDRWLDEMGFFRKHTARDASCLFRAVAEIVYNTQRYYHRVRMECVHFMAAKRHLFEGSLTCPFENYLKEMSNPSESGGLVEISAMSHLYRRDFVIFEANKGPQTKIFNGYGNSIYLYYSSDTKHFDVVYTKDFINTSSFCQSLVYEILYDGVYQLKDLSYAVDKMLHEKVQPNHIEYFMSENVERRKKQKERAKIFVETTEDRKDSNNNAVVLKCKHHTEDLERASLLKESLSIFVFNRSLIQLENVCMNCLNVNSAKDLLDNGITPFPYKVAKALDPDIYRNIEFDVWSEMRRELRYGARYSDGTTLQVGVKCLVKLREEQSAPYRCHIQEMRPDGGPCLVFIEELGEKRVVKYEQLEPLPSGEARPWAPPYRYSRTHSHILSLSQMLQQIGSITRKQGLCKPRKPKVEEKVAENTPKLTPKISWNDMNDEEESKHSIDLTQYQHLDFSNFEPMPVEVEALPLMVDCRPSAGAAHELHAPNGAPPQENNHAPANQQAVGGSGDMAHGVSSPAARASTPATTPVLPVPYGGAVAMGGGTLGYAPYYAAGKVGGVVWVPPPPPPPVPPPPQHVNPHVFKSVQPNGSDLPMNDIPTLRYYFNLGVECMWAAYGPPPPLHPPPHRHYPHRDIAQEMQAMSLGERGGGGGGGGGEHKHKPHNNDKAAQGKGNPQRTLLGPRFNKHGNQNNQNQNKGHNNNNNMPNKGPNNRRNSHDARAAAGCYEPECAEGALLPVPYMPYPPPIYPPIYYPIDSTEPGMMGMMSGMGYVNYEEGGEFVQPYYPHPLYAPPPLAHHLPPAHHAPLPPPTHHHQQQQQQQQEHNEGAACAGAPHSTRDALTTLTAMSYKVTQLTGPLVLGEGPHWDHTEQALYFVSIHERSIHKYVPATGTHTNTTLEGRPGFIIPVEGAPHQFVVGLELQLVIVQWDGQQGSRAIIVKELGAVDQDEPTNRLNDGKADPRGRLFAGTMGLEEPPGTFREHAGSLYRLDSSRGGDIDRVADNIGISNGLAWDLKEKAFYYTDSLEINVRRYEYDVETGNISNPRHIFDLRANGVPGFPDGSTIDTDGNLWIAIFDGSCVIKLDPRSGKLLEKIPIPAKQVTSVTFGGPNLDVLFVTSASMNIGGEQPPPCGATFMVTGLGVKGRPNVNFKL